MGSATGRFERGSGPTSAGDDERTCQDAFPDEPAARIDPNVDGRVVEHLGGLTDEGASGRGQKVRYLDGPPGPGVP